MQLPIPFWSAGQREFIPLLLGLYHLTPSSRVPQKGKIKTVIIEELETGLHPEAINAVMLTVIELINRCDWGQTRFRRFWKEVCQWTRFSFIVSWKLMKIRSF